MITRKWPWTHFQHDLASKFFENEVKEQPLLFSTHANCLIFLILMKLKYSGKQWSLSNQTEKGFNWICHILFIIKYIFEWKTNIPKIRRTKLTKFWLSYKIFVRRKILSDEFLSQQWKYHNPSFHDHYFFNHKSSTVESHLTSGFLSRFRKD